MNKKVLKTLEYNKIIDRLSDCACSELGKEKCRKLEPISDLNKIKKLQNRQCIVIQKKKTRGQNGNTRHI